jgi:hypothetical protein
MKLKSMLLASLALSACGAPQTSRLEDRVDPAELRGTVLVRKPTGRGQEKETVRCLTPSSFSMQPCFFRN